MKRVLLILLALALLLGAGACQLQKLPDPTAAPTAQPTEAPAPTPQPTAEPAPASAEPTQEPTPESTAQPTPEPTAEPTPEPTPGPALSPTWEDYPLGPAGYALKDPDSFAARAEGHYVLVNYPADEASDEWGPETELDLYAVGDNLYGFISEWGFAAMEFFPAEGEEGFGSTTADSMLVNVQSFSIQSNLGEHWSRGIPAEARMVLTEEGVTFTDFDHQSGDSMLLADTPYVRTDTEPGHMDAFCYRDYGEALEEFSPPAEGPLEPNIMGLYRVLGEADYAPFVEFGPDGLVQFYHKRGQETVTLLRGSYTAGVTEDGEADVRMLLIGLGWGSAPQEYNLRCRFQADVGGLACSEGDFGDCLLWDGAVLLPVTPADVPTLGSECLPAPGSVAFSAGTYRDVWDMELIISEIGAFYYYPANDDSMEYMVMGRADEAADGLMLYAIDQETGEERLFANAYYGNANCLILEFAEGGMPQPFVMEDIYSTNTNRLEGGEWYHMDGESSIHHYSVSEDGSWYGYGVDPETEAELSLRGTWQPAEGGGDYRCYSLFGEDGSFYDYAYVYYSVADAGWVMSLASSGDVYG